MSENLIKSFACKIESPIQSGEGGSDKTFLISGIANSGQPDRWDEVMPMDCWDLKHFELNPIMLYNHNHSMPIGRVTKLNPTEQGLEFIAEIGVGSEMGLTQVQKDVRSLIAQGVLGTLSVGFIAKDWAWEGRNGKDVLVYKSAELTEISVVTVPMDAQATITGVAIKSCIGRNKKEGSMPLDYKDVKEIISESNKELLGQIKSFQASSEALKVEAEKIKSDSEVKVSEAVKAKDEAEAKVGVLETELASAVKYIEEINATLVELAGTPNEIEGE